MERARRSILAAVLRQTLRRVLSPRVSWRRQRAFVNVFGRGLRSPRDVRVSRVELGGVPAEHVEAGVAQGPRAVLLLHSGGYTVASARSHRALAAALSSACGAPVWSLDYRLAPEHPYPAALDDTIAACRALRDQGAERLALAGDSAGGGLALAAAVRLRDAGEPTPSSLALICPTLDQTLSGESMRTNAGRDAILSPAWLAACADAYAGQADRRDPGLSPLFADLEGLPPIHLQSAGSDPLLSDAERFEQTAGQAGVRIEHRRHPRLWHDFQTHVGLLPESDAAIEAAGASIRREWDTAQVGLDDHAVAPR